MKTLWMKVKSYTDGMHLENISVNNVKFIIILYMSFGHLAHLQHIYNHPYSDAVVDWRDES